jgi:hypothetical protein
MTIETRPGTTAYTYSSGIRPLAHPSIAWLRGALVAAIAAQVITVSALNSPNFPLAASWASLWLAIAPAPLAAVAVLAPKRFTRPAIVLDMVVLLVGIVGGITHTGLFFVPEFAVLVYAMVREQQAGEAPRSVLRDN